MDDYISASVTIPYLKFIMLISNFTSLTHVKNYRVHQQTQEKVDDVHVLNNFHFNFFSIITETIL